MRGAHKIGLVPPPLIRASSRWMLGRRASCYTAARARASTPRCAPAQPPFCPSALTCVSHLAFTPCVTGPPRTQEYYVFRDGKMHTSFLVVMWMLAPVGDGDGGFCVIPGSTASHPALRIPRVTHRCSFVSPAPMILSWWTIRHAQGELRLPRASPDWAARHGARQATGLPRWLGGDLHREPHTRSAPLGGGTPTTVAARAVLPGPHGDGRARLEVAGRGLAGCVYRGITG